MKCFIYDVCSKNVKYAGDDGPFIGLTEPYSENDFFNLCFKQGECIIILIGQPDQTKNLFNAFRKCNFNVYCCDNQTESTRPSDQQASLNDVLASLEEIKREIKKGTNSQANYSLINTSSSRCNTEEKLGKIEKTMETFVEDSRFYLKEIYNQTSSNTGSSEMVENLKKELSDYKEDFYRKSMGRFGVDFAISILDKLYSYKGDIKQSKNSDEVKTINNLISCCEAEMEKLNLLIEESDEGTEFDGSRMKAFEDDKVFTEKEELKGYVAYSVSPAVYWTLPRVNNPGEDKFLIKKEIVVLYK